jgi:CheY-like chemotaxis protein
MKILIVDNHTATVTFMRLAFTAAGHAVTTALSVSEAIGCAAAERPDVVLSDLAFGNDLDREREHDGYSLARSLRAMPDTADVGLLAVSGADSPDVLRETVDSGFDGFVSKPVDLPSLLERVDRLGNLVADRRAGERNIDRE